MRKLLTVLVITGGVAVASLPGASAMPVDDAIAQKVGANVEQVRWLCFPYYGCRWVWTPYYVYGWHPYYRPYSGMDIAT
jgi:hypothetical protein